MHQHLRCFLYSPTCDQNDYINIYSQKYGTCTGSKIRCISDLVIIQVLNNSIPKLTVPCKIFVISKSNHLSLHTMINIEYLPIGTCIQSKLTFFHVESIRGFTSFLNFIDDSSSYPFLFPAISNILPAALLR